MILSNIKNVFHSVRYRIAYFFLIILLGCLWWYFTDIELMWWNYWPVHTILDTTLSFINILAFPLFILAWVYRSRLLWQYSYRGGSMWLLGGTIGIIISGSLCCGTSLLLPLGASLLVDIFSKYLPYGGIELKIIGVTILLFGLYRLLSNLTACQMSRPKKSSS